MLIKWPNTLAKKMQQGVVASRMIFSKGVRELLTVKSEFSGQKLTKNKK
jgi:hypothetical protein